MLRKLLRAVFVLCGLILLFVTLVLVLFSLNRDRIKAELLRAVNAAQPGELIIPDMDISFFAYFPRVSVRLNDVVYSEHRENMRPVGEEPIVTARHVYVSIDVIELIRGRVDVSEVGLRQGEVNLIVYPDGRLNLLNAMGLTRIQGEEESGESGSREIDIRDIDIQDTVFRLNDGVSSLDMLAYVKDLSADITHREGEAECRLVTEASLGHVSVRDRVWLKDREIETDLAFRFDTDSLSGRISRGDLDLGGVNIGLDGEFGLKQGGLLDLRIDATGAGPTLLSLLLAEDALRNNRDVLRRGDFFLTGSIRGEIFGALPLTELSFGAQDVRISIPGTRGHAIQGLGFSGSFHSGTEPDLSQAQLRIEDLRAEMPGGDLTGTLRLSNLRKPRIYLEWSSTTDLSSLDRVFRMGDIESLSGIVSLAAEIDGEIDPGNPGMLESVGTAGLRFDDVSVKHRGWDLPVEALNGTIEYSPAGLVLKDVSLQRDRSRLMLSGNIQGLLAGLFDRNRKLSARLMLESEGMRLGDLLFFRSLSPAAAGLQLRNMALDCSLQTTASVLSGFRSVPPGDFEIHSLRTEIVGYPEILGLKGRGRVEEGGEGAVVPLEWLTIELPFGTFGLDGGQVSFPRSRPILFNTSLGIEGLRLPELTGRKAARDTAAEDDTQPAGPRAGLLNAAMRIDSAFPRSPLSLEMLRIIDGNVSYTKMNGDEILLTDIDAILRDVEFGPAASQLPIKGLAAWTMELGIEHIHSPLITDLGLSCTAEGQGDAWSFDFDTDGLIGEAEEGRFEVHFRGQQPVYRLRYEILDFEAADLQAKLREESLLRGKMDILADLSSTGKGWRELLHNTNGQIVQRGEDLLLQGVDLDKILENFKRSQAFNLADVGAFFLAGPLGVMATKGGDFARLTNMTEGDRTQIPRLLSHVQINGGIFETRDVAFTTTKNRIALKGKVDLPLKRIESLAAAAVDKQGCILISQSVSGDFKDPQWGKVDVVGTLLGAVVNILKLVAGDRCQPFYTGSVPHPER